MIIKILDQRKEVDAWFVLANVEHFYQKSIHYRCKNGCETNEACSDCPSEAPSWSTAKFVDFSKPDLEAGDQVDCLDIYAKTSDGHDHYLLAEFATVYIMNDDGKTIDRF